MYSRILAGPMPSLRIDPPLGAASISSSPSRPFLFNKIDWQYPGVIVMLIRGVVIGPKNCVSVPEINLLVNFTDARALGFEMRFFAEKTLQRV